MRENVTLMIYGYVFSRMEKWFGEKRTLYARYDSRGILKHRDMVLGFSYRSEIWRLSQQQSQIPNDVNVLKLSHAYSRRHEILRWNTLPFTESWFIHNPRHRALVWSRILVSKWNIFYFGLSFPTSKGTIWVCFTRNCWKCYQQNLQKQFTKILS